MVDTFISADERLGASEGHFVLLQVEIDKRCCK